MAGQPKMLPTLCTCMPLECILHVCFFPQYAGNVEENDTVSRALSRLSEVQEKVESLHYEQVCARAEESRPSLLVSDSCA